MKVYLSTNDKYIRRKRQHLIFNLYRLAFIEDYTLKSLRLKPEKWNKLVISDDQRGFLHSFVDQGTDNVETIDIITADLFILPLPLIQTK